MNKQENSDLTAFVSGRLTRIQTAAKLSDNKDSSTALHQDLFDLKLLAHKMGLLKDQTLADSIAKVEQVVWYGIDQTTDAIEEGNSFTHTQVKKAISKRSNKDQEQLGTGEQKTF